MVTQLAPADAAVDLDEAALRAFAVSLRGALIRPHDAGYDEARAVWNAMIDRRPALVVRCAGVADVVAALAFARAAVADGALVVDLSPMKGIRAVRVEGGATWAELDHETQAFGLATTGGTVSATGVGGLTLGGGLGWLMRAHGLACDNLLSADVVTADGRFLTAGPTAHADLFWGLRGGGGNFGVVTSFEFRLHEVGPTLIAGPLFHPLAAAHEALRFYRDVAPTLPEALICHAALLTSPDGARLAALLPAYVGPTAAGEAAVAALRAFGPPAVDLVGPMPYHALQTIFDAAFPAGRRNYWKSGFLPGLEDAAIDLLVEGFARAPSPSATVLVEQLGGAVGRVGADATAFPHRSAPYNVVILSAWDDPAGDAANVAWARDLWTALRPFLAGGVYVNYLGDADAEGEDRVRAAYGPNHGRLAALKGAYDPANRFRSNQNIAPMAP